MDDREDAQSADLLRWAMERFGAGFAIGTSFQKEGMVIIDMAWRIRPDIRVFTLDTGRLPDETYRMIETVERRYGTRVEIVRPDQDEVARMVEEHGADLFYRDPSLRLLCCEVRKTRPLERKLRTLAAWATGLRREQSESRAHIRKVEENGGALKLSPLADWTSVQVEEYIRANGLPVHPLYSRGYTSIGCAPCTRAVAAGEDARAGRWWWEQGAVKECGIHFSHDGRVLRTNQQAS